MLVVLASTSPWRRGLLEAIGFAPRSIDPEVDEAPIIGRNPIDTARLRAAAKAEAAAHKIKLTLAEEQSFVIVAADQVVYLEDQIFGKPENEKDWLERLQKFRATAHELTTAVNLIVCRNEKRETITFEETTTIRFRSDLSDEDLQSYIRLGEAKNCAGGYMIERGGAWLIEEITGDYSNVIGLPIPRLLSIFQRIGARPTWL